LQNLNNDNLQNQILLNALHLDAVGDLAGGVAHEFNNILMSIMGYISLVKLQMNDSDPKYQTLSKAEVSCLAGKKLTQELLSYTQPGKLNRKSVNTASFLKKISSSFLKTNDHEFIFSFPENLSMISVDLDRFSLAITNIYSSVFLTRSSRKILEISARNVINPSLENTSDISGNYVEITINHHGSKSNIENSSKRADPFYFAQSRALGLVLTSAFFIIRHHEGVMTLSQDMNKPVCRILIPAVLNTVGKKHFERILVVDDDPAVLQTICELLEILGYSTISCRDIATAKQLFHSNLKNDTSFELIMIDFLVLGRNPEFIREMRDLRSSLRSVVMSSCTEDQIARDPHSHGFHAFLPKPVSLATMRTILAEIFRPQEV